MAIRNEDGSVFEPTGSLQQFDPENPEFELFNSWDQESIRIGGTPVYYYEVKIQSNTLDPLYLEDRGKLWAPKPICLYGFYEPTSSKNDMTVFGVDAPDELMIEFNYQDVLSRIGHAPRIGSRFFTPHRREHWVLRQNNVEEFKLWGQLRLQCMCGRFQESLTTGEGKVTQQVPDTPVVPGTIPFNSIRTINS